jgi:large subunit ribosomal protein L23
MKPTKDILNYPHMTEKSTAMRIAGNQYVFRVKVTANKVEIKQAIEARFQVVVESVNTIRVIGKVKRTRGLLGRRAEWKKAVVRLKEGDAIKEIE